MDTIWTTLLAIGAPSAIFGGLVSFYFRRIEKKMDKDRAEREAKETAREESELFQIKMLSATAKLCEANAIALQNGKCNGETHAALDYLKEVKHDQRDFLIKQGIKHLS